MVQALQKIEFEITHVRGNHHYLRHPGSARFVVAEQLVARSPEQPVGVPQIAPGPRGALYLRGAPRSRAVVGAEHGVSPDLAVGGGLASPKSRRMRVALGAIWSPAPTSPNSAACSSTRTRRPSLADASVSALPRPPIPPPTTTTSTLMPALPSAVIWST
jgi:hypothetical protein